MSEQRRERAFDATFFGIDVPKRGGSSGGAGASGGSLAEAAAPVFLLLTTFRRNSRSSRSSFQDLRGRIKDALEAVRKRLDSEPRLRKFEANAWYVLVVTADQAVLSSEWSQIAEWRMQLLESEYFGTATGGQRFFQVFEEVLSQSGEDAAELAELLFTCMALGFQGELLGDSRRFEKKRMALYDKAQLPSAMGDRLAPEAYGRNDKRSNLMLPRVGLARVILVAGVVLLVFFLVGQGLTKWEADKIRAEVQSLKEVE